MCVIHKKKSHVFVTEPLKLTFRGSLKKHCIYIACILTVLFFKHQLQRKVIGGNILGTQSKWHKFVTSNYSRTGVPIAPDYYANIK